MLGLGNGLTLSSSIESLIPKFSLSLDGTDDRVTLASEITLLISRAGNNGTISFWSKRVNSSTRDTILGAHNDVGSVQSNYRSLLELTTTPKIRIESIQNGEEAGGISSTDYSVWHHYVVTWSGRDGSNNAQAIWYEDGSAISMDSSNTFGLTVGEEFTFDTIGAVNNTSSGEHEFTGLLYQLAFWDVTLAAAAVVSMYNSGIPIPLQFESGNYNNADDLVHLYKFNEGSGTTTADSVGSVNGTLKEDATFSVEIPTG